MAGIQQTKLTNVKNKTNKSTLFKVFTLNDTYGQRIALLLQGGSKFYQWCWLLPVLYVFFASFSHAIFEIFSHHQINIVSRSLKFLHRTPPIWWVIKCHRLLVEYLEFSPLLLLLLFVSVDSSTFGFNFVSVFLTVLQCNSIEYNFYFLQSGSLEVYRYDLDCIVLWELPGTSDEIFSTLLLYILTHIFAAF